MYCSDAGVPGRMAVAEGSPDDRHLLVPGLTFTVALADLVMAVPAVGVVKSDLSHVGFCISESPGNNPIIICNPDSTITHQTPQ